MNYQDLFNPQEWQEVLSLPVYCAALVITGDLSQLPGLIQESQALYQVLNETREQSQTNEIAHAAARMLLSRQTESERQELLQAAELSEPEQMLAKTAQLVALVNNRLPPEIRDDYYHWNFELAVEIAQAAREGGFLGVGGVQISREEQAVLDRLAALFQFPPGSSPR